ncbi:MAG: hypothetical protein KDA83_08600 [Planctomycetales bacterium]|nr:hypothetical protein [Planctomycetales bacterium]
MSWHLETHQARWHDSSGGLAIDLTAPELGAMVSFRGGGTREVWGAVHGQVIGAPAVVDEAYVRGRDLIVHYAENPETQLTTTLSWRVLDANELIELKGGDALFVELVVATRTSTLGVEPRAELLSVWPPSSTGEPTALAPPRSTLGSHRHPLTLLDAGEDPPPSAIVVFPARDVGQETRFTWVHPSDGSVGFESNEAANAVTLRHPLNLPLLEKGVIRSARVRWLAVSSSLSDGQLTRLADLCFDAELPIST